MTAFSKRVCADLRVDERVCLRNGHPDTVAFIERYDGANRMRITFITDDGSRIARSRFYQEPLSTLVRHTIAVAA